jgi:hypothetical protein
MAADVIDRIVEQNMGVYRAAPSRLQEDVSQEAQVASDYRGRLVYELLQNADDAMADGSSQQDRVSFLVTDHELWIANSGRPLTDDDIQGLCGLGASSKVDARGTRRASIGHKGLGFKSVLEISEAPAIYSRTHSFELGEEHARRHVEALWSLIGASPPSAVPAMRFPSRLVEFPGQWSMFADIRPVNAKRKPHMWPCTHKRPLCDKENRRPSAERWRAARSTTGRWGRRRKMLSRLRTSRASAVRSSRAT